MRILIGYDGSDSADEALNDLEKAGLPNDSKALVISVGDVLISSPSLGQVVIDGINSQLEQSDAHGERVMKKAEESASSAADRVHADFPKWDVSSEVSTGPPAWSLIDAASRWNASLITVGSQGRSALGRLFLGSVSKRLVMDAPCSVRVARRESQNCNDRPPRLIIGVDGSPAAEEAIYSVGQRVWADGTEVRLVSADDGVPPASIVSRLPQAADLINSYLQSRKSRVAAVLDWATSELNHIGLKTSVFIEKGDPKNILLAEASKWNADCIFVGTRDFSSAFERFRLGSVSTAVVTNAQCSVEVVRPPLL